MGSQYGMIASHTQSVRANLFLRYYSEIDAPHGFYSVSIDGSEPEQLDGKNDVGQLGTGDTTDRSLLTPVEF